MTAEKEPKLHYMDLLNEITSGERRAGIHLQAWADTTAAPELKACLSMVADRETSHYHIFKRRIAELGYTWDDNEAPDFEECLIHAGAHRIMQLRLAHHHFKQSDELPGLAATLDKRRDIAPSVFIVGVLVEFQDAALNTMVRLREVR